MDDQPAVQSVPSHIPSGPARVGVDDMFNRIARRYDVLNTILSLGLDATWRKAVRKLLPDRGHLRILDVACGTGALSFELAADDKVALVAGVDFSEGMLAYAKTRNVERGNQKVQFEQGDATDLSSYRGFDVATIAFGIRNVNDTLKALTAMRHTLVDGGRILVLEFSEPTLPIFSSIYRFYRRYILPRIGGLLSGDMSAYAYLDETIATFPSGQAFCALLHQAGFRNAKAVPLTLGTVTLYHAEVGGRDASA